MELRAVLSAFALFALSSCAAALPSAPSPMLGKPVSFELPSDDGQKVGFPLTGVHSTVIELWSPTCEPCAKRVPALVARELDIAARGGKLVLVASLVEGEMAADAAAALEKWGLRGRRFAIDQTDAAKTHLGVKDLPGTVILDGGVVKWVAPVGADADAVVNAL